MPMIIAPQFVKLDPSGEQLPLEATEWVAVYDATHDLTWSRTLGQKRCAQPKALAAAAAVDLFGHNNWRLPTRAELLTLVDDTRYNPAIDVRFFPDCRKDWYWTSTPAASSPSVYAWGVDFGGGVSGWGGHGSSGFVRAVRPGQSV